MRTEAELKNQVQKAQRADELLNDPLVQEFIVSCKGKLLHEFESSDLEDNKKRDDAWRKMQVLNMFLDNFQKAIREGKSAKLTLLERANGAIKRII